MGLSCLIWVGCQAEQTEIPARKVNLYQDWDLQPGDVLGNYQIQSGLGDVAVDVQGKRVYMPFDGLVEPDGDSRELCVVISSAEVPAYIFRLCGLDQPHLGDLRQGDVVGTGSIVAFATLRKQTDGTWAMVEPAKDLLVQFLTNP
ncbi:hypothetical protein C7271_14590 [filamentous cyanobacterium CCP5]|nr:hypothetical protein C7271_14590 [filamentous cyanobacterium CCP5]